MYKISQVFFTGSLLPAQAFTQANSQSLEGNGATTVRIGLCEANSTQRETLHRWTMQICAQYGIMPEILGYGKDTDLLDAMQLRHFDIILLSKDGPEGFLSARHIREADKRVRLIFLTDTGRYAVMGVRLHLTDYIVKPFEFSHLVRALKLAGIGGGR